MNLHSPIPLVDALKACADLWCERTGRTKGALSTLVVNHGGLFGRLESPDAGISTGTLEKFAAFLRDPANWPGGELPGEVCAFVHRVEGCTPEGCAATGSAASISRRVG